MSYPSSEKPQEMVVPSADLGAQYASIKTDIGRAIQTVLES